MSEPKNEEKPSKSQLKREMIALQKLGETLVELPNSQLAKIPVPEDLLEAVKFAKTITNHEAKRRQFQYIGKIMREIDPEPIQAALKRIQEGHQQNTTQFHQIEKWREQLITGNDETLQHFLENHPEADRQKLRQLVRTAKNDQENNNNTGGATKLFRYLTELVQKK